MSQMTLQMEFINRQYYLWLLMQTIHNKLVAYRSVLVLCIDSGTNPDMSLDELHILYNV